MKKNISIHDWCSKLNFEVGNDRKHIVQAIPTTPLGDTRVGSYVPTKLDEELERLHGCGAKVLGFKVKGVSILVKTMVPR